jgi:hypothetical protein
MRELGVPAPLLIAVAGAAGLTVQALALRTWFPAVWDDVSSLIRRVLPARPALGSSGPDPTLIG